MCCDIDKHCNHIPDEERVVLSVGLHIIYILEIMLEVSFIALNWYVSPSVLAL